MEQAIHVLPQRAVADLQGPFDGGVGHALHQAGHHPQFLAIRGRRQVPGDRVPLFVRQCVGAANVGETASLVIEVGALGRQLLVDGLALDAVAACQLG